MEPESPGGFDQSDFDAPASGREAWARFTIGTGVCPAGGHHLFLRMYRLSWPWGLALPRVWECVGCGYRRADDRVPIRPPAVAMRPPPKMRPPPDPSRVEPGRAPWWSLDRPITWRRAAAIGFVAGLAGWLAAGGWWGW